ncbi:hypothetical protein Mapa_017750 [Marchantia paleacea]|nr:hypothetical protein Mapa_017750 [Marchantia paleacea]
MHFFRLWKMRYKYPSFLPSFLLVPSPGRSTRLDTAFRSMNIIVEGNRGFQRTSFGDCLGRELVSFLRTKSSLPYVYRHLQPAAEAEAEAEAEFY